MPKFGFFNANGLQGKADEIIDFVHTHNIDIFFVVETWLNPNDSTYIIRPFLNVTQDTNQVIAAGGRRARDGILGFTVTPALNNFIRILEIDPKNYYAFLRIVDVTIGVAYFPPSLNNEILDEFLERADHFSSAFDSQCVLLGDFNARVGQVSRDSVETPRGRHLLNLLDQSPLSIHPFTTGRFTTFSGGGMGVTDLVLSNNVEIQDLQVHETETLGGSDHRPLTFEIADAVDRDKDFSRWNVRKLAESEVRIAYSDALEHQKMELLAEIETISQIDSTSSGQDEVDLVWTRIKSWISQAADASCGKITYKSFVNPRFWTDELRNRKEQVKELATDLQRIAQSHQSRAVRQGAQARLTVANREYRELLQKRRTEVFDDVVNDLSNPQNQGAFLKMVKCIRSRRQRTGCKLDPEKIDTHAEHYRNTFGGLPMGQEAEYSNENAIPPNLEYAENSYTADEIQKQIKRLAYGKAAGVDGIMAEFLIYGDRHMAEVLTPFFNLINHYAKIPTEWRTAMIVPIFKNKGSDKEIKYYRPIALTCITRRLYERMICQELDPFMDELSDYQGGFRPRRSTLDQVFCLQEIMTANPGLINVFLDFQTAYDRVDRRILWSRMHHRLKVPWNILKRLMDLFDANVSTLLVAGRMSTPIENLRGLLQGSSLSPILFNFFIDELIQELTAMGTPKLTTSGIKTNCLFFADDGNVHAKSIEDLILLLLICEIWSNRVGMRFEPTKSVCMGAPEGALQLYGIALPVVEETPYLGVIFNSEGIAWESGLTARMNKTKGTIVMLARVGLNGTGWPLLSSINVYKSFCRSQMEYGLALTILPPSIVEKLQKVQNLGMRTLGSAHKNTSINAMQKLFQLVPMKIRNRHLNVKFACKLHNSWDGTIPAVNMWWKRIQVRPEPSLVTTTLKKNPWWPRAFKINHVFNRLARNRCSPAAAFTPPQLKRMNKEEIVKLDRNATNTAGAIQVELEDGHRHCLRPKALADRKQRMSILHWLYGIVVRHQPCKNCPEQTPLSRQHALECSGAQAFLLARYPDALEEEQGPPTNILSRLLNRFRLQPPHPGFYLDVQEAISRIYSRCMGFLQKENGFWQDEAVIAAQAAGPAAPAAPAAAPPVVVRVPRQSAARTLRRREIALERNRPLGRPRSGVG
jgi:hypothetical protein